MWSPDVYPPESTTLTFSGLVTSGSVYDTIDTEGWPNRLGKSLVSSGLPAAELAGPSTTEKLDWRIEGRGSVCRRWLVCTYGQHHRRRTRTTGHRTRGGAAPGRGMPSPVDYPHPFLIGVEMLNLVVRIEL